MIPNGTGGLEDRMPVLWNAGVNTGRLTKEEFVAATSTNIGAHSQHVSAQGAVMEGSDADIVIWDPKATKTITASKQVSRIEYKRLSRATPAPACRARFSSRGKIAWTEGDMRAKPGDGDFVAREPNAPVHVANAIWKALPSRSRAASGGNAVSRIKRHSVFGLFRLAILWTALCGAGAVAHADSPTMIRNPDAIAAENADLFAKREFNRAADQIATLIGSQKPQKIIARPSTAGRMHPLLLPTKSLTTHSAARSGRSLPDCVQRG